MSKAVLNEDWSDYDNRKKKGIDSLFFSCEEEWEVDYLVKKVMKHHSGYTEAKVRAAIRSCCATVRAPRPRKEFVECVILRLSNPFVG